MEHIVTANPAAVELERAPFPEEWVLEGNPEARAKEIARSDDARMTVIVWSCTPGRFRWQYSVDEMVQIISGEVTITDDHRKERRLGPGDTAFFRAGSWSVWHVTQEVRKVAVCHANMPKMVGFGLRVWEWGSRRAQALLAANTASDSLRGGGLTPAPGANRALQ